ncbi:MAG: DNA gyrase subunit A, partial [Alphaproteobacteria bacterium]
MPENNDPSIPASPSDIEPIKLEDEMQRSYLDYAMSVIVSRALPDVRDGLKPVHRRILYAMKEGGYDWNRAYRKSAKAVGDVMGNYHPHGDAAIYMTLVRMAQPFSMSVQLIDGQGNFGSIDDDPPAAMRYTESRLTRIASQMLEDIDKTTVDFQPNYDESTTEPQVLPAQFPNFLVNGAGGIAVGMATNVPPHNLSEAIDACIAYAQNREIAIDELMEIIPGPDFPTGGSILGRSGIHNAYHTGRGSVVMRAKAEIVARGNDREQIIFTEMPYQVNKAKVVTNISQLAKDKVIEGISEVRDESDREGIRLAVDVKRDHQADVVLNQLWRHTQLQTSFGCNMLAIDGGRPEMLNLQRIIQAFVNFREEVITRRTAHELEEARRRSHILVGLAVAVANIDMVIDLIRRAPDPATAKAQLMERKWNATDVSEYIKLIDDPEHALEKDGVSYYLSERQAQGILALQLSRLTGLERDKIGEELKDLSVKI